MERVEEAAIREVQVKAWAEAGAPAPIGAGSMTNALMVVGAVEGDMNDRDFHHERRPRSQIPGCQRGRSKSPGLRRNMSPIREGSAGRRANIEQWNLERERKSTDNGNPLDDQ
ncbi:hypothetical protein AMTR_s00064p00169700 [Amborella trichopoda]|uniref:Uncharacterized protein n=1 Tax=Amborella trichopoda TaxID=13333 RepID=U5DH83_AMBTC|nr:hypothetical protein AMTR_s00064p00169700 [Amborella trichopoda]